MEQYVYSAMESNKNDWWERGKAKIIASMIQGDISRSANICEIGAGVGLIAEQIRKSGYKNISVSDSSSIALEHLKRKGFETFFAYLPDVIETSDVYDVVLLLDILEHTDDDVSSLARAGKILRSEGRCIITVPAFSFLWTKKDEDLHHRRRYTKKMLERVIRMAGFRIQFISYYNFFLFPLAVVYSIFNKRDTKIKRYNPIINNILYPIFSAERIFLNKKIKFPFGVSLIAIIQKR